jgi:hypothetical protein
MFTVTAASEMSPPGKRAKETKNVDGANDKGGHQTFSLATSLSLRLASCRSWATVVYEFPLTKKEKTVIQSCQSHANLSQLTGKTLTFRAMFAITRLGCLFRQR